MVEGRVWDGRRLLKMLLRMIRMTMIIRQPQPGGRRGNNMAACYTTVHK